ncbi:MULTISPECIES: HTH domain-containing protein [Thermococcus]|nr:MULTISPECIES: HTH domain-containing protein [Thermococcus]
MKMAEVELVFKVLKEAGKPLKSKEIAELAGIDKKEVDKAIKVLKKEGKIISPKRCYYAPAE